MKITLEPTQFMDRERCVNTIEVTAQSHIHQHELGPMRLGHGDGNQGGPNVCADLQSHVLQKHAPVVSKQSIIVNDKDTVLQFGHDGIGMGMRISVIVPVSLRTVIVPSS